MPTAQADITTEHATRYLARLCGHADKMGAAGRGPSHRPPSHAGGDVPPEVRRVECSGTEGTVSLNWGQWTMRAFPGLLAVRAEAADEASLRRDPGSPHRPPAEVRQTRAPDGDLAAARCGGGAGRRRL